MDITKGTITWPDSSKKGRAKVHVRGTGITKAKVEALAVVIDSFSNCTHNASTLLDSTSVSPTFEGNSDKKGVVVAQEPNGVVHKWLIPDVVDASKELVEGTDKERIVPSDAETIVAAFATCTGLTLTALTCPIIQR